MSNTLVGVSHSSPENKNMLYGSKECHTINNTLMHFGKKIPKKAQTGQNITALSILEIVIS